MNKLGRRQEKTNFFNQVQKETPLTFWNSFKYFEKSLWPGAIETKQKTVWRYNSSGVSWRSTVDNFSLRKKRSFSDTYRESSRENLSTGSVNIPRPLDTKIHDDSSSIGSGIFKNPKEFAMQNDRKRALSSTSSSDFFANGRPEKSITGSPRKRSNVDTKTNTLSKQPVKDWITCSDDRKKREKKKRRLRQS